MKNLTILGLIFTLNLLVHATEEPQKKTKPVQERPKVEQGNVLEPKVKIVETSSYTMREYRINGVLRAIRVVPKNGMPAYLLVDRQGTGQFERIAGDDLNNTVVPEWTLFEW